MFDIPPTQYKKSFRDDVKGKGNPVHQTYREEKTINSEHFTARLQNENLPSGKVYRRLHDLHRQSRDLTGRDHKKDQENAEPGTNEDADSREKTKLSITTDDPMVELNDTLSEKVTTSGKGQSLNRTQVAVRDQRSKNCPASPDGGVSFKRFDEQLYLFTGAS